MGFNSAFKGLNGYYCNRILRAIHKSCNVKKTEKRRERVIMRTWKKGENGQCIRWREGEEKRQGCKGRT